jgi:alpha-N-acetylglucosamine transferase
MRPHQLSSDQAFKTSVHKDRRKEGRKEEVQSRTRRKTTMITTTQKLLIPKNRVFSTENNGKQISIQKTVKT